jgi:hypothetical protein
MRTTLDLDPELLEEARRACPEARSKTELLELALRELVKRRDRAVASALYGSMPEFEPPRRGR